jgi:hypothetical protein
MQQRHWTLSVSTELFKKLHIVYRVKYNQRHNTRILLIIHCFLCIAALSTLPQN